jgi:hypothetical protein
MTLNPHTDELLRGYLLGDLPGPEAERLELRLLADDDLFDLMEALEAELLAAAGRGELAPAERERVLRRLASSPEGRERLALARSLNTLADQASEGTVVPFRGREAHPKAVRHWLALAAAAFLALVGLFWFSQRTPHSGDSAPVVVVETPAPAKPAQPPPAVAPVAPPKDRLADKREEIPPVRKPEPVRAVLQIALTTLRGAEEEAEPFPLPANTEVAEIQVDVEGLTGPFHAAVRGKDGGTLWEKSNLEATKKGTLLVLEVPAKDLTPGHYEVAVTAGSDPEVTREIEVIRQDG